MQEHMNELPVETVLLSFEVPRDRIDEAIQVMKKLGFDKAGDSVSWLNVLKYADTELPGVALAGARYREGLTQAQLSQKTGIPRRHISEMENGKRPVGKQNARKLGQALNIDPGLLLNV